MTRFNQVLAGLAALQIAIFLIFHFSKSTPGAPVSAEQRAFLEFTAENVGAIEISSPDDANNQTLKLERKGDGWVVASKDGFPAKSDRILSPTSADALSGGSGLLDKLAKAKIGAPQIRKKENHGAVKVADSKYERRVTIFDKNGNQSARFFCASGSRSRYVYVRREGEDDVYETDALSTWDLTTSLSSWVDTKFGTVKPEDVMKATFVLESGAKTVALERRQEPKSPATQPTTDSAPTSAPTSQPVEMVDVWYLTSPAAEKAKTTEVDSLIRQFDSVYLSDVVGKSAPAEGSFDKPLATLTLELKDGKSQVLTVGAKKGEDSYYVKSSASEYYVTVSKWSVDALIEVKLEKLQDKGDVATPEAPEDEMPHEDH